MTAPMERARVEAELRGILRESVRHPDRPIDPRDHLIFDLEIEDDDLSLDVIPEIHRHFGIEPPAAAWSTVETVSDVVALIERWQRQPLTPEERAREDAAERDRVRGQWMLGRRFLAGASTGAGVELAGGRGLALFMLVCGLCIVASLPSRWREGRSIRRARVAWKARRAAEAGG